MSALDYVHAYEHSPLGQFFISIPNDYVIAFQIVHVFSILSLLTAVIALTLRTLGAFPLSVSDAQFSRLFFRIAGFGLLFAILSGILLFLTSATHYFTNQAFPVKLILIAVAAITQFLIFRTLVNKPEQQPKLVKTFAVLSVVLWFATGFAGRAIGFV
jgi:hypothetical protein